jgi:ribonuclease HII
MAAVAITLEQEAELKGLGIQDSKKYGSGKKAKQARLAAVPAVRARCHYAIVSFYPDEIDEFVEEGRLDDLERKGALMLLEELEATTEDRIICDGEPIFGRLRAKWGNLRAENKADERHTCVSAASIIAKVERDRAMDEIIRKYEPEFGKITGGGYVNKGSRAFLAAYEEKHGKLPFECRKSWTWREKPKVVEGPDIMELLNG